MLYLSGPKPLSLHPPKKILLFSPLGQETASASEQGPKHSTLPLAESGASWREGCSPAALLALTLASVMSSICILSRAMSYCGGGAGLFFSLIQLSHMLTVILSPLSKAAGSFAITSSLLRLHVSKGLQEIEMRLWNHKGNVMGKGKDQKDLRTDQGVPERKTNQGPSLMVWCSRICLPTQGMWVRSLVG